MSKPYAIGIDIGGSHVSCQAVDLFNKGFCEGTFSRGSVDPGGSVEQIIKQWCSPIWQTIQKVGLQEIAGIGIAVPGPFDYEKGTALFQGGNAKYAQLHGIHVTPLLRQTFTLPEDMPIRFINDSSAFAIGEDWVNSSNENQNLIALTLGTGLGSTFLSNSLPVLSGDTVPAHGSLWPLPYLEGNVEDYLSSRGIVHHYEKLSGIKAKGVKEIADKVDVDPLANKTFLDFGNMLADFLMPWLKSFQPDGLLLGGNISHALPLFEPAMQKGLSENNIKVSIRMSSLMEEASLLGAARLLDDGYYNRVKPLLKEML